MKSLAQKHSEWMLNRYITEQTTIETWVTNSRGAYFYWKMIIYSNTVCILEASNVQVFFFWRSNYIKCPFSAFLNNFSKHYFPLIDMRAVSEKCLKCLLLYYCGKWRYCQNISNKSHRGLLHDMVQSLPECHSIEWFEVKLDVICWSCHSFRVTLNFMAFVHFDFKPVEK